MGSGAITGYIDVAQLVLYAFWIFFAGLIYYLHRENKREGYPLESDRSGGRVIVQGFPAVPEPKSYLLRDGSTVTVDGRADTRPVAAKAFAPHLGAPLVPTGDPLADGVGPAAYAARADRPDMTVDNQVKIVPLRVTNYHLEDRDPDPRGMAVVAGDGQVAGKVVDVWVDRSEVLIRYFEAEVAGGKRVLVPHNLARVHGDRREIVVRSLYARNFAGVPALKHPEQVTLLEEDKIMAYYCGGTLYADAARQEPLF